jgi:UDP-2-acetamido-3-amino-2,3-dideoxy-glucuronate N-acetyltransferase
VLNAAQKSLDSAEPTGSMSNTERVDLTEALNGKGQAQAQHTLDQGTKPADYFAHKSAVIDDNCAIGQGTKIWHFSHIMSNSYLGENCNIGQNVVVGPDVSIGNNCKIQNNVSVYKGVTLEDGVFCGPSMVFTNIYNPRAEIRKMDQVRSTLVKKGATLGANATIICGTTLGSYSFIGAGAVVNKNVPDHAIVVGNPAKQIGWACHCGERLDIDFECHSCGNVYKEVEHKLILSSKK